MISSIPTRSVPAVPPRSLFESLFISTLAKMPAGALRLELPRGESLWFGSGPRERAAEIRVKNPAFFRKCALFGDIGFGESYVDGDWTTDDVSAVIAWFLKNLEQGPTLSGSRARRGIINALGLVNRWAHNARANTRAGSRRNIAEHYDLSNDFFRLFLDPGMTYSCAYFQSPELSLEEAQTVKYDVLCRKLRLKPSDHVLEIGGGWGGFSLHAARNYGCRVTSATISHQQYLYALERIRAAGLAGRVELRLLDYRRIEGRYDKIVSIEMLEAVGDRYLETYFAKCHELLKPQGLLGLQYITCPDSRYASFKNGVDWIQKHVFPGSLLLSQARVMQAINRTGDLNLHDFEDIGHFYARTLELWEAAFETGLNRVRALGFSEAFIRKWRYYLNYCKAGFQMRNISAAQSVYSRPNNPALNP